MIDAILRQHHIGRHVALRLQFAIDRPEVHIGRFAQKILETVDDEIDLLIIVDAILDPHQPLQTETDPVGRSILQREHRRSKEHTSELKSLMRNSYAVFWLKKKNNTTHK